MKEQIREIIERNNREFLGSNEANLHASEEIEDLIVAHQTNSLLIAMLESQLKVEKVRVEFVDIRLQYAIIEELERQLKELKG